MYTVRDCRSAPTAWPQSAPLTSAAHLMQQAAPATGETFRICYVESFTLVLSNRRCSTGLSPGEAVTVLGTWANRPILSRLRHHCCNFNSLRRLLASSTCGHCHMSANRATGCYVTKIEPGGRAIAPSSTLTMLLLIRLCKRIHAGTRQMRSRRQVSPVTLSRPHITYTKQSCLDKPRYRCLDKHNLTTDVFSA